MKLAPALALSLAIALRAGVAAAAPSDEYAAHLMEERDYFRAISAYKELAFFETDVTKQAEYRYRIGLAYRLSRKFDLSVDTFTRLLVAKGVPAGLERRIFLQLSLDYVGLRNGALSTSFLDRARAPETEPMANLIGSAIFVEEGRVEEAAAHLDALTKSAPPAAVRVVAAKWSDRLAHASEMGHRSPFLAGALSTVLPGAGQVYTGHYVDALQAFGFVGAFAAMTFVAWRHDEAQHGPYALTGVTIGITSIFHLANIIGAVRTANYFNKRQQQLFLDPITTEAEGLEF